MLSKAKVKYIQSLGHKKLRDEKKVFMAEGPKVVEELLKTQKFICRVLCATQFWFDNFKYPALQTIEDVCVVEEFELQKISQLAASNGVLAIFTQNVGTEPILTKKLSLVLDGIRDPGNMGTIIRIADWFSIDHIICSMDSVDCYNPKVVQASMGSIARVNIVYRDIHDFIATNSHYNVYAATLHGKNVFSMGKVQEGLVVIGNESTGIRTDILGMIKYEVSIPRLGNAESLNAAVACGIIIASLR